MNRRLVLSAATVIAAAAGGIGYVAWPRIQREQAFKAYRRARAERLSRLAPFSARGKVEQLGMAGFLAFWSEQVVNRLRRATFALDAAQQNVVRAGTLLRPPAPQQAVDDWQQRFGLDMPPSMRAVYAATDGLLGYAGRGFEGDALWPVARLRWLHEEDPDTVRSWTQERMEPPDAVYKVYGPGQDVINIRTEYLRRMVCLRPMSDGATLMLNPAIRSAEGEFEAWDFSVKYPGARRYTSLAPMLEIECELDCQDIDEHEATHDLPRPATQIVR